MSFVNVGVEGRVSASMCIMPVSMQARVFEFCVCTLACDGNKEIVCMLACLCVCVCVPAYEYLMSCLHARTSRA